MCIVDVHSHPRRGRVFCVRLLSTLDAEPPPLQCLVFSQIRNFMDETAGTPNPPKYAAPGGASKGGAGGGGGGGGYYHDEVRGLADLIRL